MTRAILTVMLAVLLPVLSSCGDSSSATSPGTPARTEPPGVTDVGDVDIASPLSEQDLADARRSIDIGRDRWLNRDRQSYVMTASLSTLAQRRIEFDDEGQLVDDTLILGDPNEPLVRSLPGSVEDAFVAIDNLLRPFESGEYQIPGPDECGQHFHVRLDDALGYPTAYDSLGPCDDGIGVTIEIVVPGD